MSPLEALHCVRISVISSFSVWPSLCSSVVCCVSILLANLLLEFIFPDFLEWPVLPPMCISENHGQ